MEKTMKISETENWKIKIVFHITQSPNQLFAISSC